MRCPHGESTAATASHHAIGRPPGSRPVPRLHASAASSMSAGRFADRSGRITSAAHSINTAAAIATDWPSQWRSWQPHHPGSSHPGDQPHPHGAKVDTTLRLAFRPSIAHTHGQCGQKRQRRGGWMWPIWRGRVRIVTPASGRTSTGKLPCRGKRWHCSTRGRRCGQTIFSGPNSAPSKSRASQHTVERPWFGCR
jgi:hypothetical protein